MTSLEKLFKRGVSWGMIESILSHTILTIHTIALFKTIPQDLYGISGVVFSIMYIIIGFSTAGIDSVIGVTQGAIPSKEQVAYTFKEQLAVTLGILGCSIFVVSLLYKHMIYQHPMLLVFVAIIIIAESFKKVAKAFFALAGIFHINCVVECATTTSYTISVWSLYYTYQNITLRILLAPLSIVSLLVALYTYKNLATYYHKIPSIPNTQLQSGITLRLQALITYASHTIYSSNILVPLVASIMGMQQAGFIKLISNCMHSLIAIIEKTYGLVSTVLFSYTKNKQAALTLVNRHLLPYLNCLMPLLLTAFFIFLPNHRAFMPLIGAYMFLHISNILATSYERLLLDRNHGHILLWGNSIVVGTVFFIMYYSGCTNILWAAASSRVFYNIMIACYSYNKWNITAYSFSDCKYIATATSVLLLIVFLS